LILPAVKDGGPILLFIDWEKFSGCPFVWQAFGLHRQATDAMEPWRIVPSGEDAACPVPAAGVPELFIICSGVVS